jgi:hypothetical protein
MPTLFHQLDRALRISDVVAITRDYIARWTPEELARLPRSVRPGRIRDEVDVVELHARLVEEYRTTRLSGDELAALQRLTGFMVQAALRIGKLGGGTDAGEARPAAESKADAAGRR